jgi:hypothetical protein
MFGTSFATIDTFTHQLPSGIPDLSNTGCNELSIVQQKRPHKAAFLACSATQAVGGAP